MSSLISIFGRRLANPRFATLTVLILAVGSLFGDSGSAERRSGSAAGAFIGIKAGDETMVCGIHVCWCPSGVFMMGSPPTEPERRPDEDQVVVTLTHGFWMGKFEATQADWKCVMGTLPGPPTTELPEEDDLPLGNVNFAEAEAFCRKLTDLGHQSGELPKDWEFRLPTEAQWEYACRAGTTTATAFGDKLSSKQANFKGEPYNGAEPGPSLGRAAKVGSTLPTPGICTTCTGTPSNGVVIGIIQSCPAASIRISILPKPRPVCAEAAVGETRAGPAAQPSGCASNRSVGTTILAFVLRS